MAFKFVDQSSVPHPIKGLGDVQEYHSDLFALGYRFAELVIYFYQLGDRRGAGQETRLPDAEDEVFSEEIE
jgi:hypothetical protein